MFDDEEIIDGEIVKKRPDRTFVRMIHGGDEGAALAPMLAIWRNIQTPSFSGEMGEWMDFVTQWRRYVDLVEDSQWKKLSDNLKLEILASCLDSDNAIIIRAKISHGQTFAEIWADLDRRCVRTIWSAIAKIGEI